VAIPTPEPGLVISYAYLWHDEYKAGRSEGRKDRPCVIVLAVDIDQSGSTIVTVPPVTHAQPAEPGTGVEIPPAVKRHLGLDEARSWIVVTEGNEFAWPGYDLRRRPRSDRYDYGFLPPRIFDRVRDAFVEWHRARRSRTTPRS